MLGVDRPYVGGPMAVDVATVVTPLHAPVRPRSKVTSRCMPTRSSYSLAVKATIPAGLPVLAQHRHQQLVLEAPVDPRLLPQPAILDEADLPVGTDRGASSARTWSETRFMFR
jgi:hypothetical protein